MSNKLVDGPVSPVQSVDRALAILEYLAEHGQAGITEIARHLGVHKSTAFRLTASLEHRRMVEQLEDRGQYRLGFGVIRLAAATSSQLDLTRDGRPMCVRLAGDIGETVNIAIRDSAAAVNITQEHGSTMVATRNWVGKRTPLHATASGKVLLAWAEEDALGELLRSGLEQFTERTIVDEARLREELAEVRSRGWARSGEELELGLNSVAAPIFGSDGAVTAAVSVSGPSYRLTPADFADAAVKLRSEAADLSLPAA
ncbi:IclR family transcriptional regulator [Pseudonocardia spinosispora]|uniref:IclR family transcriptional regulator n=1 Tax=Pseudonocardia spinosispora TaxID=103441 RepID=UPI0004905E94|nr:IclR family transcriptional regulator [Pseudonocardia spinosispora]